jgi:putative peptidoglycan lipid II flippase
MGFRIQPSKEIAKEVWFNKGQQTDSGHHAALVALGILLSRIAGLIRDRIFAHYFGNSDAADAFKAAFRIPNFLQNLFGEGVLSASFIPVYASLLAQGDRDAADRVAAAIFSLLSLLISILVLIGVLATPLLIGAIAPGFRGAKYDLTVSLVQILFPGAGFLALSAWCLGVLNSHRRFFVSYTAPVLWNLMVIVSLLGFGSSLNQSPLAKVVAWGSVVGSALQFGVQFPLVVRLMSGFRWSPGLSLRSTGTVLRNFVPAFLSRGVVQISAYVDALLASLLPTGAVAALTYAQTLYTLPVSLFGMAVSAAELPALSSALGEPDEVNAQLRSRLNAGLRRIAFFVVPSAMAFFTLGDVIVAAIYQTGQFTRSDSVYVWGILAGSGVGLLAATLGRLYASAYYALKDTRTPLRYAVLRVLLTAVLGYVCALPLPPAIGLESRWGVAGLTASAGVCGWLEFLLLRNGMNRRIRKTGLPVSFLAQLWAASGIAAAGGWGVKLMIGIEHPIGLAIPSLGAYGLIYLGMTKVFRVPEATDLMKTITGRIGSR